MENGLQVRVYEMQRGMTTIRMNSRVTQDTHSVYPAIRT